MTIVYINIVYIIALAIVGLTAHPMSVHETPLYLYENIALSFPYRASHHRYLVAGPFDNLPACQSYRVRTPQLHEDGVLRSYECSLQPCEQH